ncbi:MAG: Asp-tRNA(Asn)/Glu-tRNA(Gln) amidotransferase subunit GatA [Candidatus Paceibacterota bacterium]
MINLTIKQAQKGLQEKTFSAKELTESYLNQIKEKDKDINAYLSVCEKLAISQAEEIDKKISKGEPLSGIAGIPCAIKDNIMIKGEKCTAASKILENYTAIYDATVIQKLKEAGAVFLGKTNLDEFAMGGSCEKSAFFPTKNPHDLERVPGGSSGGSAAAVASDMAVYALGSDTGGSIRQPASFCGIVGMKPTYGAVSRYGLIAYASSLDQIGPMGKTVEDCETIFNVIKGSDKLDSTSTDFEINENKKEKLRIGVPKEYFGEGLDKEIEDSIKKAINYYQASEAEIIEINLPHTEYVVSCYYIIALAEASANLARFDGLKYGKDSKLENPQSINELYFENRTNNFGAEVRKRIMIGTYTLSSGYYDAYYKKALQVRTLIKQDFEKAFENVDIIVGPASPCLPFKTGEMNNDPLAMYLADIYTAPLNLAGLPGISVPCGKSKTGLPIGLQITAPSFCEKRLFDAAKIIEQKT